MVTIFFKTIVQFLLKWLAKIYLWRFKPYVILIAGTTGRHWIKEKVKEVLEERNFSVRANKKNFNAEIGLPLSIVDLPSGEAPKESRRLPTGQGIFWGWLKILGQGIQICLSPRKSLSAGGQARSSPPKSVYLVLEMAIDRPENINYLTSIVKPDIVILTTVTMIYAENFENLDEIGHEYGELVKTLPWDGILILNNDDLRIRELKECFDGKVITFGFSEEADFQVKNIQKVSDGQKFEISVNQRAHQRQSASIFVKINRFGKHHIYAELVGTIIRDNFLDRSFVD